MTHSHICRSFSLTTTHFLTTILRHDCIRTQLHRSDIYRWVDKRRQGRTHKKKKNYCFCRRQTKQWWNNRFETFYGKNGTRLHGTYIYSVKYRLHTRLSSDSDYNWQSITNYRVISANVLFIQSVRRIVFPMGKRNIIKEDNYYKEIKTHMN